MVRDHDLLKVIGGIYDAAGEPSRWPDVLRQMAAVGNFIAGSLHFQDLESHEVHWDSMFNIDPQYQATYRAYYSAINPWRRKDLVHAGNIITRHMAISTDAMLRTEFYNDWARPQDLFDYAGGVLLKSGTLPANITLFRSKNAESCGQAEAEFLSRFMPHLTRAMQLQSRIGQLHNDGRALNVVLDHLPRAVVVLDSKLRVLQFNRAAKAIFDQHDGLTVHRDTLRIANSETQNRLAKMLREAAITAHGQGFGSGGTLTISRPSVKRPYYVLIAPLRPNIVAGFEQPATVMFISDPELTIEMPAVRLGHLYGLTAAEARLAQKLVKGIDLNQAAEELVVTRNTVKRQLQEIFEKTLTRRQPELIRLLMTGPASLGANPAEPNNDNDHDQLATSSRACKPTRRPFLDEHRERRDLGLIPRLKDARPASIHSKVSGKSEATLLELVGLIYEASLNQAAWTTFLEGAFSESDSRILAALVPHLQRSLQLHRRMVSLENRSQAAAEALDRLPLGLVLVNERGKVLIANRLAKAILDANDGLTLNRDGLSAGRSDENTALTRLICGAAITSAGEGLEPGGVTAISRPSLKRPFALLVTPLHSRGFDLGQERPAAAIFLSDPEKELEPSGLVLARLFGFTPAESKVAALLMQGKTIEDISDELAIRLNTARTHVKRLLDKTNTRRQSELMRLLLSSPAGLQVP